MKNPGTNTMKKIVAVDHPLSLMVVIVVAGFLLLMFSSFNTIAQSDLIDTISSNESIVDNSAGAYLCIEITAMMKFTHR